MTYVKVYCTHSFSLWARKLHQIWNRGIFNILHFQMLKHCEYVYTCSNLQKYKVCMLPSTCCIGTSFYIEKDLACQFLTFEPWYEMDSIKQAQLTSIFQNIKTSIDTQQVTCPRHYFIMCWVPKTEFSYQQPILLPQSMQELHALVKGQVAWWMCSCSEGKAWQFGLMKARFKWNHLDHFFFLQTKQNKYFL